VVVTDDIEREIDALFDLSPDQFTRARDELAVRLTGDRAREVKKLRRPTVAAWAVNLLARRERDRMTELAAVGERLRTAQRAALSGRGADELRTIGEERRTLVRSLTERAQELVGAQGSGSTSSMDEVAATLEAASADEESARAVSSGRLQRPLPRPAGFGDLSGLTVVPGGQEKGTGRSRPEEHLERKQAERELREAQEAERRARDRAERLRREVEDLEERITDRKERLRAAEAEVRGAAVRVRRARSGLE
jgi:hypothetical protein